MCLSVYQKSGDRVLLAAKAKDAVLAGDIETAEKLYFSVTGEKFHSFNKKPGNSWLLHCMANCIMEHVDDHVFPKREPRHNDDSNYYERLRANAEKFYGGIWAIAYEY